MLYPINKKLDILLHCSPVKGIVSTLNYLETKTPVSGVG